MTDRATPGPQDVGSPKRLAEVHLRMHAACSQDPRRSAPGLYVRRSKAQPRLRGGSSMRTSHAVLTPARRHEVGHEVQRQDESGTGGRVHRLAGRGVPCRRSRCRRRRWRTNPAHRIDRRPPRRRSRSTPGGERWRLTLWGGRDPRPPETPQQPSNACAPAGPRRRPRRRDGGAGATVRCARAPSAQDGCHSRNPPRSARR